MIDEGLKKFLKIQIAYNRSMANYHRKQANFWLVATFMAFGLLILTLLCAL